MALAFLFYYSDKSFLGNYFIGATILTALFFPLYSRWRYKNHYLRHIKETYQNNFEKQVKVKLTRETIETNDESGQSIINTSQLTNVFETKEHFFLKLLSGQALVIPKNKLHNLQELQQAIYELTQALGINHTKNENWAWK